MTQIDGKAVERCYIWSDEYACGTWVRASDYDALLSERDALLADNEAIRADNAKMAASLAAEVTHSERLRADVERKDAALREVADEIDAYISQEYPLDHPVHERYRERDFAANPARAALSPARKGEA